jgi:acetone carboxylase gamma subunit
MNTTWSISPTLVARDGRTCCRACGHAVAPLDAAWKDHAVLDERPIAEVGGPVFATDGGVLLRRFFCPGCGGLLDSETALPGEPFLIDRVDRVPG